MPASRSTVSAELLRLTRATERKSLTVNYRSRKQIVDSFGAYASGMRTSRGRSGALLHAERGAGVDVIDCNIATDREAEIAGIAAAIARYRECGIAYREQAVLCRSHAHLERFARGLEGAGIPVFYLGDLFERPEVRDLLAMLSFIAEPHRGGLYRIATLPSYRMPLADVRAVLAYAAAADKPPIRALDELHLVPGLSETGRAAQERLRRDLAPFHFRTGPGVFLCKLLFQHSGLLRGYLSGDTVADQQRRLAIHQFLQFAIENNSCPDGGDPKRALLDWVRRLEVLGDEMALREPTAAVDGIDAVRLMTVHASKGLEFRAVHLPALGAGMFPARRQGQRCPAPDGVLPTAPADDHDEEEECLFFVALSRARDHLSLSRAMRYSERQNSNASEALKAIAAHLPRSPDGPPSWTCGRASAIEVKVHSELAVTAREHDGRDVDLYLNCPRRYLYQVVLGLSGSRNDTAYVRFHRAVYKVLRWLAEQPGGVNNIDLLNELGARWQDIGPVDHPLQALYRSAALRIVTQAHARPRAGIRLDETLSLRIADHVLRLPIDEIEGAIPGGIIVRRLRTGRAPQRPDQRMLHALMLQAARQNLGDNARLELHYLTTTEAVDPGLSDRIMTSRLGDCRDCLEGLAAGRYPAVPADREDCPRCAHYFICPAIPD